MTKTQSQVKNQAKTNTNTTNTNTTNTNTTNTNTTNTNTTNTNTLTRRKNQHTNQTANHTDPNKHTHARTSLTKRTI